MWKRDVSNAALKSLGYQPRETQWRAAEIMESGGLAEMKTGEGKTLAIALAALILSQKGHFVRIATANEYLAQRDSDWMRPIYHAFDVQCGCIGVSDTPDKARVVYGTLRQFAFEFLTWKASLRAGTVGANEFLLDVEDALIVDEADSLLLDEALTPLVIQQPGVPLNATTIASLRWAADFARDFRPCDYHMLDAGQVAFTDLGKARFLGARIPSSLATLTTTQLQHCLERAVAVHNSLHVDDDYLLEAGCVRVVDEYTGRSSQQRTFARGVQQAIEAKHGILPTVPGEIFARTSLQDYVHRFQHLAAITATAWNDRDEFHDVYELVVQRVSRSQPSRLNLLAPVTFDDQEHKIQAICQDTQSHLACGRPVLVGTRSIAESEQIAFVLSDAGVPCQVLNAKQHRSESRVIASAGVSPIVTVATNMAGRGTDIPISAAVRQSGGLHVIVSQLNSAARIDEQLIGRCARHGDPGSAQVYVSGDDRIFQRTRELGLETRLDRVLVRSMYARARKAQSKLEKHHRAQRALGALVERDLHNAMRILGLDANLDVLQDPI